MPVPTDRAIPELIELYEIYRRAALNREYYGNLLSRHQTYNTIMDVLIALGAASSGISGLALIKGMDYGQYIWGILTLVSTVLAISKPFLQLNKKIERYSRLFTGHLDNYLSLDSIVIRIRRKRELSEEMIRQFEKAAQRYAELSRSDDPTKNIRLCRRCEKTIKAEIPDSVLWYPESEQSNVTPLRTAQGSQA